MGLPNFGLPIKSGLTDAWNGESTVYLSILKHENIYVLLYIYHVFSIFKLQLAQWSLLDSKL